MRRRGRILALACAGLLAGCAGFGAGSPPPIYDLTAPQDFPGLAGRSQAQILIPVPKAIKALDTEAIAVKPDLAKITYFGDGQWSDTLPKLLQARLVESFEKSGRVRAIGRPGEGLLINYQLATDIRAFQLETKGGRRAVVEIAVKLLDDRNGRVRAADSFRAEVPAPSDTVETAVDRLNAALDAVLVEIVIWVVKRI